MKPQATKWIESEGVGGESGEARPLRCFFDIESSFEARAGQFRKRFGVEPQLRAALHLGDVIAGEVGVWRRAIVFHGDVMNTASRLEQATRELGLRFIASVDALRALGRQRSRTHCRYSSSTLARAHGVRRRNFRLEAMLGSWVKQRIGTAAPIASVSVR